MNNTNPVRTKLEDFGARERRLLKDLLEAWDKQGLPEDFQDDEVIFAFNWNSGNVFLSNSEYQVAMITDDGKLELWHNCPYCGHEGFKDEMQHEPEDPDCTRYLEDIGVIETVKEKS